MGASPEAKDGRSGAAPVYTLIGREGPDHAPRFVVEARVEGVAPERGEGGSKREAEQDAAAKLLDERSETHDPLRLLRHHRRAQCRQIHAHQCAGGLQGRHRHAQGSDHPHECARASPWPATPRSCLWTRPGIFKPRRRLDRAMVGAAWAGAEDADAILLVVDAADLTANARSHAARDTDAILEGLKGGKKKIALVLNKIDGMKRTDLLPLVEQFHAEGVFEDVFLVSALKGEGVADVAAWVKARMPEGPWLYPEDQATDISSRLLAAEITREKIYLRLHDELPYASAVETEKWEERPDGSVRINQVIMSQRDGQKAIVAGQGRRHHQDHRRTGAQGDGRTVRPPRASVPVRQGARGLGGEPRAL